MCDSLVSTVTHSGYTIYGKNSDRSVNEPQYFVYIPDRSHPAGSKVRCTYIEIDQAPRTSALILSKPSWLWGGEMGINRHGVCIGNQAIYTKMPKGPAALTGMDMVRIGLERGDTAKAALEAITNVLEQYGQGGNGAFDREFCYDNAFFILDHTQCWLLETAGRFWAAKRVQGTYAISNYMDIRTPDLMHPQTIENAKNHGWQVTEPFDFAAAYIDWSAPGNYNGIVRRASCMRSLAAEPALTVQGTINALRSHTSNDPWHSGHFSVCKHANGGPVGLIQATNSMVAMLHPGDPMLWGTGMSIPCIAPYKPFWFDEYSSGLVFPYNQQAQAMDSWLLRERINRAAIDGRLDEGEYREELHAMEAGWMKAAETCVPSHRAGLCKHIAEEEEAFIQKWLARADTKPSNCCGDDTFKSFWAEKNAALGKNRTIAY